MARHTLVVLSNPVEGQESEYNSWYNDQHIHDIVSVDGFVSAERFRIADAQMFPGAPPHRYLALYEIETDDLAAAIARLTGAGHYVSPAMDRKTAGAWFFSPVEGGRAQTSSATS